MRQATQLDALALAAQSQLAAGGTAERELEELYIELRAMIRAAARRYAGHEYDSDDLQIEAFFALRTAAAEFNPDAGASFSTFFQSRLAWYYEAMSTGIPQGQRQQVRQLHRFCGDFERQHGRAPSDSEVCAALALNASTLATLRAAEAMDACASLDAPLSDDDTGTIADTIPGQPDIADTVAERLDGERMRHEVRAAMDDLPDEQADVLQRIYWQMQSVPSIARATGRSRGQLTRQHEKALASLRAGKHADALRAFLLPDNVESIALRGGIGRFRRTFESATEAAAMRLLEKGAKQ